MSLSIQYFRPQPEENESTHKEKFFNDRHILFISYMFSNKG